MQIALTNRKQRAYLHLKTAGVLIVNSAKNANFQKRFVFLVEGHSVPRRQSMGSS